MNSFAFFGIVAMTAALVAAGSYLAARFRMLLDTPGERSLHTELTPRAGGLAIHGVLLLGIVLAGLFLPAALPPLRLLAGWLLVLAVSLLDDVRDVPPPLRLLVHFGAVAILTWGIVDSVLVTGLAALLLVWGLNLFNFMDGMDGLAGTMALIGGLGLALMGWIAGDSLFAAQATLVAAAAGGFLSQNLPPARLFMGDMGSVGLGYLLGALSWVGVVEGLFPWQAPLILFLPFVADATLTLTMRLLQGKKVWHAHREHVYQRLVLDGRPVRQVLGRESVIMVSCALLSLLAASGVANSALLLLGSSIASVATYLWIICRTNEPSRLTRE